MTKLLGALAIAVLAMAFSAPPAEAKNCWWNGYNWVCKKKPRPYVRQWHPYRPYAYHPSYRYTYRPYHRPYAYACAWPYC